MGKKHIARKSTWRARGTDAELREVYAVCWSPAIIGVADDGER